MQPRSVQTVQSSPAQKGPGFASVGPTNFLGSLLNKVIPNAQPHALSYQLANAQAVSNGAPLCSQPIIGCMDKRAVNFDERATQDSGKCEYPRFGCTDSRAYNFNPRANRSYEGACWYASPVSGCTDPNAINFNPQAVVSDSSCVARVSGCTNVYAVNYNPLANFDNGQCRPFLTGCTDPKARNFDPNATVDSNGCFYEQAGCMDQASPSYNWLVTRNNSKDCCAPKPVQYAKETRPLAPGVPVPCSSCCGN